MAIVLEIKRPLGRFSPFSMPLEINLVKIICMNERGPFKKGPSFILIQLPLLLGSLQGHDFSFLLPVIESQSLQ